MFRIKRGIKLSYTKQGLIYFTCMDYKNQPQQVKDKILNLCIEIAKESYKALFETMTNEYKTVPGIALEHYVSERTLHRWRKKFYESWFSYERRKTNEKI